MVKEMMESGLIQHINSTIRLIQSLKYLLEKKLSIPLQQKYLAKLMGFSYTIQYNKGLENKAANALSRRDDPVEMLQITVIQPMWLAKVISSYEEDPEAKKSQLDAHSGLMISLSLSLDTYRDRLIKYKGKIYIG